MCPLQVSAMDVTPSRQASLICNVRKTDEIPIDDCRDSPCESSASNTVGKEVRTKVMNEHTNCDNVEQSSPRNDDAENAKE